MISITPTAYVAHLGDVGTDAGIVVHVLSSPDSGRWIATTEDLHLVYSEVDGRYYWRPPPFAPATTFPSARIAANAAERGLRP